MPHVLIPHDSRTNTYTQELVHAYEVLGCSVIFGSKKLLDVQVRPDILHLQWPETHYRWKGQGSIVARAERFLARLADLKRQGAKLVWTVHNLGPHDSPDDPLDESVYQQVIDAADLVVHHCPESARLLAERYRVPKDKPSLVVPHGNYLGYPNDISREQARKKLGIATDSFVYLSFGMIRGYKGIDTLFDAFRRVQVPNKLLLVAGKYRGITSRGYLHGRLLLAWRKWMVGGRGAKLFLRTIPSEDIQLYFNASDCLVLSHSSGLNSGVAVLGMSFAKTVVGPTIGCINWVLEQGDNVTYEVGDRNALVHAMERVARKADAQRNTRNLAAAKAWQWTDIASAVLTKCQAGATFGT